GKRFVGELARLFNALVDESAIEAFAIKAAMTMPALLLQRPSVKSKSADHVNCLRRRFDLWEKGDIPELVREGLAIQRQLQGSRSHRDEREEAQIAHRFSKLMMEGRVKAALRYLSKRQHTGLLRLDQLMTEDTTSSSTKTVREILEDKHPDAAPASADAILSMPNEELRSNKFHPILFDSITAEDIRASALRTEGAAGPSGLDAMSWRRLCTAFGQSSNNLCHSLAAFARKISTAYLDPSSLKAYTASRLIPLDKCPGVRPIGIGEVCRRIIGKVIMKCAKQDLQRAVGSLQLCTGQDAGCEAAVHAMAHIFAQDDTEAMIFVDAANAFNRLNRQVALRNTQVVCPTLAPVLINTYREPSWLFVDGELMLSKEGTTQGDPLAMAMYAIGTQPLIRRLDGIAKQVWYADDSAAGSSIDRLKAWWDRLEEIGPLYGYFPKSSKTGILVKQEVAETAKEVFQGTGVKISTEGSRYLGGAIGTTPFLIDFVEKKVEEWTEEVLTLSVFARTQPHAAYAAFTHGLSSKWNYLLRLMDLEALSASELLQPLECTIRSQLIPALTGQNPPGDLMRELTALPVHLGGLGLINPKTSSSQIHMASKMISAPLVDRVVHQDHQLSDCHVVQQRAKVEVQSKRRVNQQEEASRLQKRLPANLQRCMELAQEKGASTWLSALPIDSHGFALHKAAFKDALSLRYDWPLENSPSHCSCGQPFSVEHALSCPTGGFPSIRHNEVRDMTASLLTEVCHGVSTEPHLQPMTGEAMTHRSANVEDGARLDVAVQGFWGGRFEKAFLDIRVFNPSARSNRQAPLQSVYRRHELEKKRQYEQRIREVEHATFTPLVLSSTGGMGKAASVFYKRLASMISEKRDVPYSKTIGWLRCRLSFALLRCSIMCIRGSRSSHLHPVMESIDLQLAEGQFH
ncbi:MAG: reverse transcriptase domain-containing protein, partial [Alphaproteobacteria bacterium]|nr:reverse transcriptase domain-containing protein [Alphaproteobacteria bacterium]